MDKLNFSNISFENKSIDEWQKIADSLSQALVSSEKRVANPISTKSSYSALYTSDLVKRKLKSRHQLPELFIHYSGEVDLNEKIKPIIAGYSFQRDSEKFLSDKKGDIRKEKAIEGFENSGEYDELISASLHDHSDKSLVKLFNQLLKSGSKIRKHKVFLHIPVYDNLFDTIIVTRCCLIIADFLKEKHDLTDLKVVLDSKHLLSDELSDENLYQKFANAYLAALLSRADIFYLYPISKENLPLQVLAFETLREETGIDAKEDLISGSYFFEYEIQKKLLAISSYSESDSFKKWLEKEALTENSNFDTPDYLKNSLPGFPPFIRGPYATMYRTRPWTIRQYAGFSTAEESNAFYKRNLKAGQKGLSVAFDLPTHRGYDSSEEDIQGDVGKAGVAIDSIEDMHLLFQDIDLSRVSVSMTMNGAVLPIMAFFIAAAEEKGVKRSELSGTIQNDILKEFLVRNTFIYPPEPSMRITGDIIEYCGKNMPRFNTISISGYHMHEAGATAEQEIAYTLSDGIAYLKEGLSRGINLDTLARRFSFFWGIGMNFPLEIAKMRAARCLWAHIVRQLGSNDSKSQALRTHCQTSGWSLSSKSVFLNIFRTYSEASAAVFGHTQSLHTNSFDEALALPTDYSAKIARDTQLFLQKNSGITEIIDPFGGSDVIENLTQDLIEKSAALLQEIEEHGGMAKSIESGIPQSNIEEAAITKQAMLDSIKIKRIGENVYQNILSDKSIELLNINNAEVVSHQMKRLNNAKAGRNNDKVATLLSDLEKAAKGGDNLLEIAVEAAKERATLGEISLALEKVYSRYQKKTIVSSGIYHQMSDEKATMDEIKSLMQKFEQKEGRRPRILVAKVGQDGHDRGAKVIASAFSDFGFDVDLGPLFQKPEEVARQAIENDVHIIGISSLAGGHMDLVPKVYNYLKNNQSEDIMIILGGIIPESDHQKLYQVGVSAIFTPGTNLTQAALNILRKLM